ncbi:MAG: tRNA (guanosine(46)-N7)-methyltransferase TrmB [Bacteroidia bacterium]|nr:tRNA (guanosine(46)-N7)-methyltransferase TrmB [Bacteroidia bacterium]
MAKTKLKKFAAYESFPNTYDARNLLKGKWRSEVFKNNNPLILELACGRGEYALGLSEIYPDKNFVGVDVKAARMWEGAKKAIELERNNVAFIRIQIDFLTEYFEAGEVSEIWITFPDPMPQKPKTKQRLTSPPFLKRYLTVLEPGGTINLKTDSDLLYEYTLEQISEKGMNIIENNNDIYTSDEVSQTLVIKTYYEKMWLEKGLKIKYLKFAF